MVSASPSFSPGLALNKVANAISNQFAAGLKPIGIRPSHYGVLRTVAARPGISQQDIGDAIGLAPSWIMSIIDELEGSGLLERRRDPADRRKHQVHLTTPGRDIMARAEEVSREIDTEVMSSIPHADRDGFLRGLQEVVSLFNLDL
jgi:DNA-binding MarR family transcriptional regulator